MNTTQFSATNISASTYEERQAAYLRAEVNAEFSAGKTGGHSPIAGVFTQIPRLALGIGPLDEARFDTAFEFIRARRDCADFALAGLLRIVYSFPASPLLAESLRAKIDDALLNFCYWYDQPGVRGMCFHTENHQILFHSCEMLAGQRFPDRIFANDGNSGAWHAQHGAELVKQWIDQRARFGFVEWLSNCYFEEDLLALLNLYDFAEDAEIRRKAGLLVDMILLEIALHQYQGVMASTHGRTYARWILRGSDASTTAIAWLAFGLGEPRLRTNFALASFCTSGYRCPAVIQGIAHDRREETELFERHGLDVQDAPAFDLRHDRLSDNMFFWACQTARHPLVRTTALQVAKVADDPWLVDFVTGVDQPLERCRKLVEDAGGTFDGDAVNTALSAVNLVTFRTPDYQLSCAQDFRPAKPGYQQHIWQATLGDDAAVFTSHPGTDDEDGAHLSRPNFWAGNRWLPRAAQHRNVLVCLHHVLADDPRPYSHAFLPRERFDETLQRRNWTFARRGDGYLALYSQHPAQWAEEGPYAGQELRADAPGNAWICEMGRAAVWGSFDAFVQAVLAAPVMCGRLDVQYHSPSLGEVSFGWNTALTVAGQEIPLHGYPRFANPYIQAELGARQYKLAFGAESYWLDFAGSGAPTGSTI